MMCAWDGLLEILPQRMRDEVDRVGSETLQQLRLRLGAQPELVLKGSSIWLNTISTEEDISYCIQSASRYSPWRAESLKEGYITASGGHRVGLCGLTLYRHGLAAGVREITSVCIRVARDYPGIAGQIPDNGSVLIIGAPGWGKTTLLRDLIRQRGKKEAVSVVDERGELFPNGFDTGLRTDILRGCKKGTALDQLLRTMGPSSLALDEITAEEDCAGLLRASGCGVTLLATAHAGSYDEYISRTVYRPLVEKSLFQWIVVLHPDKTYSINMGERMP